MNAADSPVRHEGAEDHERPAAAGLQIEERCLEREATAVRVLPPLSTTILLEFEG